MEASADKNVSSEETLFDPTYHYEHSVTHYRSVFPGAGLFRCSKTDLLFQTTKESDVYYRTVYWDDRLVQSTGKTPAGLLFKIECTEEVITQLHLAHALINVGDAELTVAQITDEGLNIVKPVRVTKTHVIVNVTNLMTFGLVSNVPFFSKPVNGQILLYLRPPRRRFVMSVFVLPSNIPITELEAQHENDVHIKRPNCHCVLTRDNQYSLLCNPHRLQPELARFFMNYGPNYHATFEVFIDFDADNATFEVKTTDGKTIWKQEDVDISDHRPEGVPSQPKV